MNVFITAIDPRKTDTVLLIPPVELSEDEVFMLREALNNEIPDVHFVILSGGFTAVPFPDGYRQFQTKDYE